MDILDVHSLSTNILLEENLNLSYSQTDIEDGLSKLEFKRLRPLAMKISYFLFNELLYKKNMLQLYAHYLNQLLLMGFFVYKKGG